MGEAMSEQPETFEERYIRLAMQLHAAGITAPPTAEEQRQLALLMEPLRSIRLRRETVVNLDRQKRMHSVEIHIPLWFYWDTLWQAVEGADEGFQLVAEKYGGSVEEHMEDMLQTI